jgi:hypothetical protein
MLNPEVLCRWASGKKVYLGGMSILSILLSIEPGCHILHNSIGMTTGATRNLELLVEEFHTIFSF